LYRPKLVTTQGNDLIIKPSRIDVNHFQCPAPEPNYHGFHIGGLPAAPPPYTHLWAWSPGWLIRLRVDLFQIHGARPFSFVRPALAVPNGLGSQ